MSHMVIYRTADGQPGYHQTDEMDEAIKYVERLRNGDGVDGARIFRLEEVNFDFRPYFKVEIGPSGDPIPADEVHAAAAAPPVEPEPTANGHQEIEPTPLVEQASAFMPDPAEQPDPPAPSADEPEADDGLGARRGLFGR